MIDSVYKKLKHSKRLRFEKDIKIKSKTFKEFLDREIFDYFFKYRTVTSRVKKPQCRSAAFRSIGDIYSVVKFYFPDTTPQEFIAYFFGRNGDIKDSMDLTKEYDVVGHYCCTIQKGVYFHKGIMGGTLYNTDYDEYDVCVNDYIEEAQNLLNKKHEKETSNIK